MKVNEDQAWNRDDAPELLPIKTNEEGRCFHAGCFHSRIWERLGWFYLEHNVSEKFRM